MKRPDRENDMEAFQNFEVTAQGVGRDLEVPRQRGERERGPDALEEHFHKQPHRARFLNAAELEEVFPNEVGVVLVPPPGGLGFRSGKKRLGESPQPVELAEGFRRRELSGQFLHGQRMKMEGEIVARQRLARRAKRVEPGTAGNQDRLAGSARIRDPLEE